MTSFGKRQLLKHLGTIRGNGSLSIGDEARDFGPVRYEIDSYRERAMLSANGQIEGDAKLLALAYEAGAAQIALHGGRIVDVVLSDPQGSAAAEIMIPSGLPL